MEIVEVLNPVTGRIWMDRNLGAERVATSSSDALAYGDLYQWGRLADGHQLRDSGIAEKVSTIDQPGHADFILGSAEAFFDWRRPQNDNLWQGADGINNPCPPGFRLPTAAEWETERLSWSSNDSLGALNSPLKLPAAGHRNVDPASILFVGTRGGYWSSTVDEGKAMNLYFDRENSEIRSNYRTFGRSVRCIKD